VLTLWLWLITLIVADADDIAPIVRKVQDCREIQPADGIDWLDLLETVLIYSKSRDMQAPVSRCRLDECPRHKRGGQGVTVIRLGEGDKVSWAWIAFPACRGGERLGEAEEAAEEET
jgi:hypothetical protein